MSEPAAGMRGAAHTTSARELAERTGASFVVFGQLIAAGADSVRVVASLLDVASGSSATEHVLRGVQDHVADLADSLTLRLLEDLSRGRVIQTLRLRGGSRAPLPALKAFLQGERLFRRASWDSALVDYERASAPDSTFTFALFRAGTVLARCAAVELADVVQRAETGLVRVQNAQRTGPSLTHE